MWEGIFQNVWKRQKRWQNAKLNAKGVFAAPWNMTYSVEHHMKNANLLKTAQLVRLHFGKDIWRLIQIERILKVLYVRTKLKYGKNNETYTA